MRIASRFLLVTSLVLYLVSMFLPAYYSPESRHEWFGYECLFFSLVGLLMSPKFVYTAFFANFPYFIRLFLQFRKGSSKTKIFLSATALILAINCFKVKQLIRDEGGQAHNVNLSFGGFIWLLAIGLILILDIMSITKHNQSRTE
jgi:hypothetical protein